MTRQQLPQLLPPHPDGVGGRGGLPPRPDVLDGVGQLLLLRDLRPTLAARLPQRLVARRRSSQFINRAKDELVTPGRLRRASSRRSGGSSRTQYGELRRGGRAAPDAGATSTARARCAATYAAHPRPRARGGRGRDRRALRRRRRREDGRPRGPTRDRRQRPRPRRRGARSRPTSCRRRIDAARRHLRRATAPRWRSCACRSSPPSTAPTRTSWSAAGALDFGEQIAAVDPALQDAPQRPAPLAAPVPLHPRRRVPGRQHRPDRAHRAARPDAGPARQRHGRGRRRPVDLPLPRRQLRRLRRVRPALLAAARPRPGRPRARAAAAPAHRAELPLASSTC